MRPMKVVVRYKDGRIAKGYIDHFDAEGPFFHLDKESVGGLPIWMGMDELKAVFLVKTFEGNPDYNERKVFYKSDRDLGRKVEIKFLDGEMMQGTIIGYDAQRSGFFLIPPDPESNNISIFAISKAVINLRDV
jgi:small nuclear ribonucleoprotein (snRNP)-like protein